MPQPHPGKHSWVGRMEGESGVPHTQLGACPSRGRMGLLQRGFAAAQHHEPGHGWLNTRKSPTSSMGEPASAETISLGAHSPLGDLHCLVGVSQVIAHCLPRAPAQSQHLCYVLCGGQQGEAESRPSPASLDTAQIQPCSWHWGSSSPCA